MSISILKLGTTGIKDSLKWYVKNHSSEIAIIGVMIVIGVAVALVATGDISQAFAGRRR